MLKILNKILGHTDEYKYNLLKQTHELLRKHHFEHHRDNCTLVPTDKLKEMQATISLVNEGEPICDVCHIKPMLSCGCDVPENWKTEIDKGVEDKCQSCFDLECNDRECEKSFEIQIALRKIAEYIKKKPSTSGYIDSLDGCVEWLSQQESEG